MIIKIILSVKIIYPNPAFSNQLKNDEHRAKVQYHLRLKGFAFSVTGQKRVIIGEEGKGHTVLLECA